MEKKIDIPNNMFAPNLVNICVDKSIHNEFSGRLYHCYDHEPWIFTSMVQLLKEMEYFYDTISFPQASTLSRNFKKVEFGKREMLQKVEELEHILVPRREAGTFLAAVRYRQNSTWQGQIFWMEQQKEWQFVSTLEFIKIIDGAFIEGR